MILKGEGIRKESQTYLKDKNGGTNEHESRHGIKAINPEKPPYSFLR